MNLTLTPIVNFDEPFLLTVYGSARAAELQIAPWSDEQKQAFLQLQLKAQHQHYTSHYPNASYHIVKLEENRVGRIYVARLSDKIKILDISILDEYRNRGIGTKLVKEILREAEETKKPVQIYVESFNRSAKLFARLGFELIAEEGINFLWQWSPGKAAETKSRKTAAGV